MNSKQFVPIAQRISRLIRHEFKSFNLRDEYQNDDNYGDEVYAFVDGLTEKAGRINLSLLIHEIPTAKLQEFMETIDYPLLTFYLAEDGHILPILFNHEYGGRTKAFLYKEDQEIEVNNPLDYCQSGRIYEENGRAIYIIPYSQNPLVSDGDNTMKTISTPWERMIHLLGTERKDIAYVYFYAIVVSFISLSLPVGIQTIIELISGGVIFNSIVLLIAFVIVGVLVSGALQVMQYTIVEILQRRIFVKAAFEFTNRIPRIRPEAILNQYAPELMNRFFDVLTIQKSLPKMLIDLTGSALQILFGLLLLALYHPLFVFFGITMLLAIFLVFYYTGPKGLKTSLVESKYKYKVVHWLEEIARTMYSFKLAGNTSLPMRKTDYYVNNYLYYRKEHFNVLMVQYLAIIGFKTFVTGGLLVIGSWLVIDRQITLGQFVATEIVIILILNAVEKLILSMSTVYDLMTAVEKIANVTDIRLDRKGGLNIPKSSTVGMSVKVKNMSYKYPNDHHKALKDLSFEIKPGERVCVAGFNKSGKNTLAKVLSGLLDSYDGSITFNNISLRDISLNSLRDNVAKNLSKEEIFDGTLLENISMGNARIPLENVMWALESVGLADFVNALPNGLQTELVASGKTFSDSVAGRLILARCIAEKPQLLILNDFLHDFEKYHRLEILRFLMDHQHPWTLMAISNDPLFLSSCDRILLLKEGELVAQGSYQELLTNEEFRKILLYPAEAIIA